MKMPRNIGPVHFIGIGGIGMSGIAEILHNQGYTVQGSDAALNPNVQRLRDMGITSYNNPPWLFNGIVTSDLATKRATLDVPLCVRCNERWSRHGWTHYLNGNAARSTPVNCCSPPQWN